MIHYDDTLFPLRLAAEKKAEISCPSLESPVFPISQDFVDSSMNDRSGLTEVDSWNTKYSTGDIINPADEHMAPARVTDRLATTPIQLDSLQDPSIRTQSHGFLGEPNDDWLNEPIHEFIDPRRTFQTHRQGLCITETLPSGVGMVANGMNLLLQQTLHGPGTTVPYTDLESGMDTTTCQGAPTPHTRVERQPRSKFSQNFLQKATDSPEKACPISSPVKRKVSPGKAKVADTERRPWTIFESEFEANS